MSAVLNSFFGRMEIKKGKLLDLGCGAGEPFARFFVDQGWTVTGVDFSAQMLALAAKYVPEMKTIYADVREVEFTPNNFEAITAIYSLFHIPSSTTRVCSRNSTAGLVPKGKCCLLMPQKNTRAAMNLTATRNSWDRNYITATNALLRFGLIWKISASALSPGITGKSEERHFSGLP